MNKSGKKPILKILIPLILIAPLFAWEPINRHWFRLPFDFGALTAVCLILFFALVWTIKIFIKSVHETKKKGGKFSIFAIFPVVIVLGLFLTAGYFEFRQQSVQFIATNITRKVSGDETALARCNRFISDLFAPMRSAGYVMHSDNSIAFYHPRYCGYFFDWYFLQGKTDATDVQTFSLNIIIHEAIHVGGEWNELVTKCTVLDLYEDIALYLGVKPSEARRMYEVTRVMELGRTTNPFGGGAEYVGTCEDHEEPREEL